MPDRSEVLTAVNLVLGECEELQFGWQDTIFGWKQQFLYSLDVYLRGGNCMVKTERWHLSTNTNGAVSEKIVSTFPYILEIHLLSPYSIYHLQFCCDWTDRKHKYTLNVRHNIWFAP